MTMRSIMSVSVLLAVGALAGCSSAPKVPQANESTRRPANDPAYIDMLKARAEQERASQEQELQRRAAAASRMLDEASKPAMLRTAAGGGGIPVFDTTARGANAVYTARFALGSTRLALPAQATAALQAATRQAQLVVVRGRTDAAQANPKDERVARARAESARGLLVQLGLPAQRIRTTWQAAGDNVAPLNTAEGRAANRRVEIEVYNAQPVPFVLDGGLTVARQ
jgi:outer membrane protein OmpA-like peptidoglycan-associated protein